MTILALTDIHGSYETAISIIKKEPSDVLIIGGDLTTQGSMEEAEDAVRRFQEYQPRIMCVAGNMDLPQHDELFVKLGVSLNGCGIEVDGVGFFGVSAAPVSPLHTPYELAEEVIDLRIREGYDQVKQCPKRVFVPHAPPRGTKVDIIRSGLHVGSTAVRAFIESSQPDAVICGHIHEARGWDTLGKTQIVNCGATASGNYAIIRLGENTSIETKQLTS